MDDIRKTVQRDLHSLIQNTVQSHALLMTRPVLVEFFDGDHNAALLLNQILYWTERTKDPNGWFHKTHDEWNEELAFSEYQVRRVIYGDDRVQNPKRNLADVGLETKVKMAPNGRNATYYRLDVTQFFGMFVAWLEEKFGVFVGSIKRYFKPVQDSAADVQNVKTSGPPHNAAEATAAEADALPELKPRARKKGISKADVIPTERVQLPWEASDEPGRTVSAAWEMAYSQLSLQFDEASFAIYIRDLVLVDYDPDNDAFTFAAPDTHEQNRAAPQLSRTIRRVLSDSFEQEVTLQIVTYKDWVER